MQKNGHVLFISVTSYSQSLPKCPCEWNTTGPKPDCIIILGKQSYNDNCKIQIKHTILKPTVQFTVTQIHLLFSFLTISLAVDAVAKRAVLSQLFRTTHGVRLFHTVHSQTIAYYPWSQTIPYYPWNQTIPYCPI